MTVMDYRTQDGLADYGFAIEFQSKAAMRPWRTGYLDRKVDPTGAVDERAFQGLDPVGGQHKGDVYVGVHPVDPVEELEQQRLSAVAVRAVLGDEVNVLEYHDGPGDEILVLAAAAGDPEPATARPSRHLRHAAGSLAPTQRSWS